MLQISNLVKSALQNKEPVVALESTLITHGLPFPANIETALAAEECVRREGATPATTAIIDGVIRVGLEASEIDWLGRLERKFVLKASRAEIPFVVASKGCAATTVAATMVCAHLAGITVFAA